MSLASLCDKIWRRMRRMFQGDGMEKSLFPPLPPVVSYLKTQNILILFPGLLIRNDIKCRQEETENKKNYKMSAECASKEFQIFLIWLSHLSCKENKRWLSVTSFRGFLKLSSSNYSIWMLYNLNSWSVWSNEVILNYLLMVFLS